MRRPQEIDKDRLAMTSIVQLTGAFEGIASAHIARLKTQAQQSEKFFKEIWATYTALRVGKAFHSGETLKRTHGKKELIIIITAEGSLSGDIDQRLIEKMRSVYDENVHDLIVVGHHGSVLLDQFKIIPVQHHHLPGQGDEAAVVEPIVEAVRSYTSATVFYQAYLSLMNQEIQSITLSAAIQERGDTLEQTGALDELITDANFIFEPSVSAVIEYMERSMLGVALSEVILESKLAQQASRFRAMSAARIRAKESEDDLTLQSNRAVRAIKDERTKEIVNSVLRTKTTKRRLVL